MSWKLNEKVSGNDEWPEHVLVTVDVLLCIMHEAWVIDWALNIHNEFSFVYLIILLNRFRSIHFRPVFDTWAMGSRFLYISSNT